MSIGEFLHQAILNNIYVSTENSIDWIKRNPYSRFKLA
jgi:hypothetical protein